MSAMESKPVPKRHLGRGLSALLGSDEADGAGGDVSKLAARIVPIERIHPGRFQPRHRFDDDQLAALTESIRANGLVQPILVRAHPDRPGEFEIVAGERRWRAAQKVPLHEMPVVEKRLDDQTALELSLIENVQRADLTPIEEAEGYRRLIDEFGNTQETLARDLGKSRSHIANALRLLTLPDPVRRLIDEGTLTAGHARPLIGRADATALARKVIAEGLNVRQAEALTQRDSDGDGRGKGKGKGGKGKSGKARKDVNTLALERDFSVRLGLKVTINDRGKRGGDFIIHYDDLDQLDDILQKLSEPRPVTGGGRRE